MLDLLRAPEGANATVLAASTNQALNELKTAIDIAWVLVSAMFVFFMQTGFALLEAGTAAAKNVQNILMKNILDACFGVIVFNVFGYALAFGEHTDRNSVLGLDHFALHGERDLAFVFFQWTFAVNTSTIFSGSIAGRTRFGAYIVVSVVVTGLIWPLAAHWTWSGPGWLRTLGEHGIIDYSGSGVVHMVGGAVGLVGAAVVGPRLNRFPSPGGGAPTVYRPHSLPLVCLGMLILWVSWFGFNAGSTISLYGPLGVTAGRTMLNTAIAPASAAVSVFSFNRFVSRQYSLPMLINAVLGGLVAITGPCSTVDPWGAILIGGVAAAVYLGSSALLVRLRIDDPLDAAPVHCFCGMWGLVAAGLLADKRLVEDAYTVNDPTEYGLLMGSNANQLGIQLLGLVAMLALSMGISFVTFSVLHRMGALRVDPDTEMAGLDTLKHGMPAYAEFELRKL